MKRLLTRACRDRTKTIYPANPCPILAATLLLGCIASGDAVAQETGELIFRDDFNGTLAEGWSFEREDRANWRVGPAGLEVRVQPGGMWGGGNNARNVMVHPIPAPTDVPVEISATFSNQPTARWEQANLVWYYDGGNMVKLGQELVADRLTIVMGREENDRTRTIAIVPLDAFTVELRLQAVRNLIRGQFRTASWPNWRDVGECDLPLKGDPKASLQFYNGAPEDAHWARVTGFTVRRLPARSVDWPRVRAEEKSLRSADDPRRDSAWLGLPDPFALFTSVKEIAAEAKPEYEQSIYRHGDGSYGWRWDRRASAGNQPTVAGVGLGAKALWPDAPQGAFDPIPIASLESLELEMDAVTRLEIDQGTHNLMVVLPLKPAGRITIWLDWYGQASSVQSLNDGYEDYGHVPTPSGTDEIQYRRKTFQGAPPRLNLKAFLEDAVQRGLTPSSEVLGVWFGNEIWTGSRGGTLVTRLNLVVNGRRYSSVPAPLGKRFLSR